MRYIQIKGGTSLHGEVAIQGSKNAALPIMAACLLVRGVTVLKNCPAISDVFCMCSLLQSVGAKTEWDRDALRIDASHITSCRLPEELVTKMRSSVILAGAMLGRCGEVCLHTPGGCVIGDRPIDWHVRALEQMGAVFEEEGRLMTARAQGLRGGRIVLPFPSVGATENVILAAALAKGRTDICGCAMEPEILALCAFLNGAGARIVLPERGHIRVSGVNALRESEYRVEPDRIVAGTCLIGVLAAGGRAFLRNAPAGQLESVTALAGKMGARLVKTGEGLYVERRGRLCAPGFVETGVYPAFPTDLQSPLLAALCQAQGQSCVAERIFNGRFAVASELNRMGASIAVDGCCARMEGGCRLLGQDVTARELRGGAALVLAGICAEGTTRVYGRQYIDRGYEDIVRDFRCLGADIDDKTEL